MFLRKLGAKFVLHGYTDTNLSRLRWIYFKLCLLPSNSVGVSWCSKEQDLVSLSTTEAKYNVSSLVIQECVWLRQLVEDVYFPIHKPTIIQGDNQSTFKFATNPVCMLEPKIFKLSIISFMTKVLDFSSDCVCGNGSKDNAVNIFTKSLSKCHLNSFELSLE